MTPPTLIALTLQETDQALIDTGMGIVLAGTRDDPGNARFCAAHGTDHSYAFLRQGTQVSGWLINGGTKQLRVETLRRTKTSLQSQFSVISHS